MTPWEVLGPTEGATRTEVRATQRVNAAFAALVSKLGYEPAASVVRWRPPSRWDTALATAPVRGNSVDIAA